MRYLPLITGRGGDWLFALNGNRSAMLAEIRACFADSKAGFETHTTTNADHDRVETRRYAVCHDVTGRSLTAATPMSRVCPVLPA